jgi:hypothetical protein
VLSNDWDLEGDALTITATTDPAGGQIVLNDDNTFTYTPPAGYEGDDWFTYTIADADGNEATGYVWIWVGAWEEDPNVIDDTGVIDDGVVIDDPTGDDPGYADGEIIYYLTPGEAGDGSDEENVDPEVVDDGAVDETPIAKGDASDDGVVIDDDGIIYTLNNAGGFVTTAYEGAEGGEDRSLDDNEIPPPEEVVDEEPVEAPGEDDGEVITVENPEDGVLYTLGGEDAVHSCHNAELRWDVDASGNVSVYDLVRIVQALSEHGGPYAVTQAIAAEAAGAFYPDVNGDTLVSAADLVDTVQKIRDDQAAAAEAASLAQLAALDPSLTEGDGFEQIVEDGSEDAMPSDSDRLAWWADDPTASDTPGDDDADILVDDVAPADDDLEEAIDAIADDLVEQAF